MDAHLFLSIVWAVWGFAFGYLFGDKIREIRWRS